MDEKRAQTRLRIHWRVALRRNGQPLLYGETLDVSLAGACVLADCNIVSGNDIDLFIQIPPKQQGKPTEIVEIRAKVQYTAFSAAHGLWRMGIHFKQIQEGSAVLERALRQAG